MHYEELQAAVKRHPFEPFNIVMSSGEKHLVDHPENMTLTKSSVVVPVYQSKEDDLADDVVFASYLHISALEPASLSRPKRRN